MNMYGNTTQGSMLREKYNMRRTRVLHLSQVLCFPYKFNCYIVCTYFLPDSVTLGAEPAASY